MIVGGCQTPYDRPVFAASPAPAPGTFPGGHSRALSGRVKNNLNPADHYGNFLCYRLPQEFIIHADIPVDHSVPEPRNAPPRDVGIAFAKIFGQKFCCLAPITANLYKTAERVFSSAANFTGDPRRKITDIFCSLQDIMQEKAGLPHAYTTSR